MNPRRVETLATLALEAIVDGELGPAISFLEQLLTLAELDRRGGPRWLDILDERLS